MPHATTDDGVKLFYEEYGGGEALLLVHEFAGDHRSYAYQVAHFARSFRTIAFNARGYPPSDVPPDPERYKNVTWNGYLTVTANALDVNPTFHSAPVNDPDDPFVRGTCGPIRCKAVYDFIDVVIDKGGRAWAAYVDICISACTEKGATENAGNEGVVGTLIGGPRLR